MRVENHLLIGARCKDSHTAVGFCKNAVVRRMVPTSKLRATIKYDNDREKWGIFGPSPSELNEEVAQESKSPE